MSFRCDGCKQPQGSRKTPNVVIVETKDREYHNLGTLSLGTEIVKEQKLCDSCALSNEETEGRNR